MHRNKWLGVGCSNLSISFFSFTREAKREGMGWDGGLVGLTQ